MEVALISPGAPDVLAEQPAGFVTPMNEDGHCPTPDVEPLCLGITQVFYRLYPGREEPTSR
jgi:hypothetical protein